jgi:hypothetical protein
MKTAHLNQQDEKFLLILQVDDLQSLMLLPEI